MHEFVRKDANWCQDTSVCNNGSLCITQGFKWGGKEWQNGRAEKTFTDTRSAPSVSCSCASGCLGWINTNNPAVKFAQMTRSDALHENSVSLLFTWAVLATKKSKLLRQQRDLVFSQCVSGFATITTSAVTFRLKMPPSPSASIRQVGAQAGTYSMSSWTQWSSPLRSPLKAVCEWHSFLLAWSKAVGHWGNTRMRTLQLADENASIHTVWAIAVTHNSQRVSRTKLTNGGPEVGVRLKVAQYVSSNKQINT